MLIATVILSVIAADSGAEDANNSVPLMFSPGIYLIGCKSSKDPNTSFIQTITPDGSLVGKAIQLGNTPVISGRLSPDRTQIGFTDDKGICLVNPKGDIQRIAEVEGSITAWSPDSKQLSFYRETDGAEGNWESFVIELATSRQTKLRLTSEYVAEDWRPSNDLRTVIFMNSANRFYRKNRDDWYALRQLRFLHEDGEDVPLTKDPKSDNIWSRFSPTGDRVAHYRRRFLDDRPLEFAVVCTADGTHAKEVFGFTEFGRKEGVYAYKPRGFPAWSPDDTTIAWLAQNRRQRDDSVGSPELVLIQANGGGFKRIPLAVLGLTWVSVVDWQ